MGDNAPGGTSKGQDVKVPISEEITTRHFGKSTKFESQKLDYEDELVKVKIIEKPVDNNRELHLIYERDADLYDKIRAFIEEKPHASLNDIIEEFPTKKHPTSDAIAKVLKDYDYPDHILKYVDDKNPDKKLIRENFERLLLHSGLILEQEVDPILECTYIKVYTPFKILCEQAKIIKLKMRLDTRDLPEIIDPPRKGFFHPITKYFVYEVDFAKTSAVFKVEILEEFEGAGKDKSVGDIALNFFPSSRRILMTHRILITANQINRKIYDDERKPLIVKRTIKSLAVKRLISDGIFTDCYPLHDGPPIVKNVPLDQMNLRAQLIKLWIPPGGGQPLDKIRLYFGEKVALYFAWLGFYTSWLSIASVVGIIVVIYGLLEYHVFHSGKKGDFSIIWDNALTVPFAFFMAVWSTCFLETWKRYNASLAYDWDVMDYEREELPRPEFYGTVTRKSPITLRQEIHFPFRERVRKLVISGFVVFISMLIVIVSVTILLLAPKLWINLGTYTSWITAGTNLVIIFFMSMLYGYVADWLTSFENQRTNTNYEDSLIIKSYFFDFVNCYTGLIYILVFKERFIKNIINKQGITGCDYSSCMLDLTIQLSVIFMGKQIFGQFNETIWPWLRSVLYKNLLQDELRLVEAKYKNVGRTRTEAPQWAKDDKLYSSYGYEKSDLEEMVVQFGFVSLFGIAFPLAPFLAWVNNILEIRFDAIKFLTSLQRPIGLQAQDIGMWENILGFISILSVLSNALIMAFHSTWMRSKFAKAYGEDENQLLLARLLFILLFENLVFSVKLLFAYLIPDVPKQIKIAMDREQYLSRMALEKDQSAIDEFLSKGPDDDLFEKGELKLPQIRKTNTDEKVA